MGLHQIKSSDTDTWVYKIHALFHRAVGKNDETLLEDYMGEYRALRKNKGWETNSERLSRMVQVITHIYNWYMKVDECSNIKKISKLRLLLRGVIEAVEHSYLYLGHIPDKVYVMKGLLENVEKELS